MVRTLSHKYLTRHQKKKELLDSPGICSAQDKNKMDLDGLEIGDGEFFTDLFNEDNSAVQQFTTLEAMPVQVPVGPNVIVDYKTGMDATAAFALNAQPPPVKHEVVQESIFVIPQNQVFFNRIAIQPLKSLKEKNPPYLLGDDGSITTKDMSPVTIVLSGMQQGYMIKTSMRYTTESNQNTPVNKCKLHDKCTVCKRNQRNHPENFNFCIDRSENEKFVFDYSIEQGHPTAQLTLSEPITDPNGDVKFNVVFSCLNSCEVHRAYGKDMQLNISVYDGSGICLVDLVSFKVKVCRNIRRDHEKKPEKGKRKARDAEMLSPKQMKLDDTSSSEESSQNEIPEKEQEAASWHSFLMKNPKHQKLVIDVIKELQGDVFAFDSADMLN